MSSKILSLAFMLSTSLTAFCTTWTINNAGTTFTPNNITIAQGDSVRFTIASSHNVREVNQTTYTANGTAALAGGFQLGFGGGLLLPAQLGVGAHYFVCVPHASMGMKGTINVTGTVGIANTEFLATISIFPNPTSKILNIESVSSIVGTNYTRSTRQRSTKWYTTSR